MSLHAVDISIMHSHEFLTKAQVNRFVSQNLSYDFVNFLPVISLLELCDDAEEFEKAFKAEGVFPLQTFESYYFKRGYAVDYALLDPELRKRLDSINECLSVIDKLYEEGKLFQKQYRQSLSDQFLRILTICWTDMPVRQRALKIKKLSGSLFINEYCHSRALLTLLPKLLRLSS